MTESHAPGASKRSSTLILAIGFTKLLETGADSRVRRLATLLLLTLIAGIVFVTPLRRMISRAPSGGAPAAVQKAALAVLPIRSLDSQETDAHLGVGIADAIVTKLASVQSIRVRPTSAIVSLEGRTIARQAASAEGREGVGAFLGKRKAQYT